MAQPGYHSLSTCHTIEERSHSLMVPALLALEAGASLIVRGIPKLLGTLVLQSQETAQGGKRTL